MNAHARGTGPAPAGAVPIRKIAVSDTDLLGSPQDDLPTPPERLFRDDVFQFIPRDRNRSLLFGPVPVRVRTTLDVQNERMIRFVDRVSAESGNATLYRGFV